MTTEEVAALLRTTPETVRYWRHIGKGPKSFKVGRRVLYARADLDAHVTEARGSTDEIRPLAEQLAKLPKPKRGDAPLVMKISCPSCLQLVDTYINQSIREEYTVRKTAKYLFIDGRKADSPFRGHPGLRLDAVHNQIRHDCAADG